MPRRFRMILWIKRIYLPWSNTVVTSELGRNRLAYCQLDQRVKSNHVFYFRCYKLANHQLSHFARSIFLYSWFILQLSVLFSLFSHLINWCCAATQQFALELYEIFW